MYQYKLCLGAITCAILSLGMILNRLYFAILLAGGLFAWLLTHTLIPKISQLMLAAQIFGYDINKKGSKMGDKKIPQCVGLSCAVSFTVIALLYHEQGRMEQHLACMITILGTILLGFVDDMIDLQWRYKLIFPFIIVIPMARAYTGSTAIMMPYPFSQLFGEQLDIGMLFYVYIAMLGIYCTNTINIFAGINGLEVGQSIIAACSQLILFSVRAIITGNAQIYAYSSFLLLIFLGSALAIMKYNAYPSQVFVGDTFCYFSGIVIANAAVFSQTSIIIHFLLIPQLINFLYSCPQLFGIYPCPRHRLTTYNKQEDRVYGVKDHMNLLNLTARILGPINQGILCEKLLLFQIVLSAIGIVIGAIFI